VYSRTVPVSLFEKTPEATRLGDCKGAVDQEGWLAEEALFFCVSVFPINTNKVHAQRWHWRLWFVMSMVRGKVNLPQFGNSSRVRTRHSRCQSWSVSKKSTFAASILPEAHSYALACDLKFETNGKNLLVCVHGHASEDALLDALQLVDRSLEDGTKFSSILFASPPGGCNPDAISRIVRSKFSMATENVKVVRDLSGQSTCFDIVVVASDSDVKMGERLAVLGDFDVGQLVNQNSYHVFPFDAQGGHGEGTGRITVKLSDTRHPIVCAINFFDSIGHLPARLRDRPREIESSQIRAENSDSMTKNISLRATNRATSEMSLSDACCIDMRERFGAIRE
jgi:hypothetical protein